MRTSTWGVQPNAGRAGYGTAFYGYPDRSPAPFLPPWLVATGIKSDYSRHGGFTQVRGFHSNHTERRPGNRQTEVACTVWTPAEGDVTLSVYVAWERGARDGGTHGT